MILRALIIDDEPLAHKVILEYAKNVANIEIVGQCYLAMDAIPYLNQGGIDLIFLDIQMPKLQGLDFLRTLSQKPIVIITSAYEEYALESFELDVCDYLLKPFRFERFFKAINKALALVRMQNNQGNYAGVTPTETAKHIFVKSDKRLIQIDLKDIYFVESYGNYVKIWLEDKYHLSPGSLSSFYEQLPHSDFCKVHKSYVINKLHIDYVEGNIIMTKNAHTLAIGKSYKQDFKGFIGK